MTKLVSNTTGLISQTGKDEINPEKYIAVGHILQKEIDGMTLVDKIRLKDVVLNLSQLKSQ